MLLSSVKIRNFRGIRSADVALDATGILIGENGVGKSSLLKAIGIGLGNGGEYPVFHTHDFFLDEDGAPVGPIRIELGLREHVAGEWERLPPLLAAGEKKVAGEGSRGLAITVHAESTAGKAEVRATLEVGTAADGGVAQLTGSDALAWIRRAIPLIWIRGGTFKTRGRMPFGSPETRAATETGGERAGLYSLVEEHYQRLIDGTSADLRREMQAGYNAARDLINLGADQLRNTAEAGLSVVSEIINKGHHPAKARQYAAWKTHGTAAQEIGVLLLVGALVSAANEQGITASDRPIVVVEDPESHLHPMTLAAAWDLLARIPWQKLITTHSEPLLSAAPLSAIRRLERRHGVIHARRVEDDVLSPQELQKFSYHIRFRRGNAMFSRCWLLVEGETEFWLLPELARLCGYDFAIEGITCVEFAQSGLPPLIKVAANLGIEWHVLADGDKAGQIYAEKARRFAPDGEQDLHVTMLSERDVEGVLWHHGYANIFQRYGRVSGNAARHIPPTRIIGKAIAKTSKPYLAIAVLQAIAAPGSPGIPRPLRHVIETCVRLARRVSAAEQPPM